MASIRGTITKFVYKKPDSGWKIARFKPEDGSAEITIKGEISNSNEGCEVEIHGDWAENGTYGREFAVLSCVRNAPTNVEGLRQWIVDEGIPGVGPGTAKKIVEKFGIKTREVFEKEPEKIAEIKGITKATAKLIGDAWNTDAVKREVTILLATHGLSGSLAPKVIRCYGKNSVQVVGDNPYALTHVSGIGFKTADKMALGMGWSPQRPERIDAALTFILEEGISNGHSFMFRADLLKEVCSLAEIVVDGKGELLELDLAQDAIDRVIKAGDIKLETLTTGGHKHELCYLPQYYELEREVADRVASLQSTPHVPPKNIDAVLSKVEKELSLELAPQQRDGVISALANNVSIITGLPGTGKTSTVRALVNTARALGLVVELAAPTGRAAKRLSEVTNLQALTIHRLLQYDPESGGEFVFNEKNKLKCNLLILDEASMIDLELMACLLRAVPDEASVVWIGDVNQLPSVGAGSVLRDLINSKRIHTTVLDKIFRQAEGSLIIQNAHRIHKGEMPVFPERGKEGDSYWIQVPKAINEEGKPVDDVEFIKNQLPKIYDRLEAKYGFDPVKDVQILAPMKKGPAGSLMYNTICQAAVNPDGKRIEIGGQTFRVGDRVMQIKNDYKLEAYNGDVGFIQDIVPEEKSLLIQWSDRDQMYPMDSVDQLALSYAVSIHKSQGSEFDVVILILTGHHHVMLDRNLVYTANTRAKKLCIYIASSSAIEKAVRTQNVLKRNSLLSVRIRVACNREMRPLMAA